MWNFKKTYTLKDIEDISDYAVRYHKENSPYAAILLLESMADTLNRKIGISDLEWSIESEHKKEGSFHESISEQGELIDKKVYNKFAWIINNSLKIKKGEEPYPVLLDVYGKLEDVYKSAREKAPAGPKKGYLFQCLKMVERHKERIIKERNEKMKNVVFFS